MGRLIPFLCAFVAAIWFFVRKMIATRPAMISRLDTSISLQESEGMQHLLLSNVAVILVFTALILWAAYVFSDSFDFTKRDELYWLYVTLAVLVAFFLFQFSGPFLFPNLVVSVTRKTHPAYYLMLSRMCVVNLLLILGVAIAIIKQKSTLIYGAAEVTVAVISNAAIIASLNLAEFPKTHFTATELVALGALAYLFSKGIGDVIEGVKQIRKRKLEAHNAS
jgi:hypothetical protein